MRDSASFSRVCCFFYMINGTSRKSRSKKPRLKFPTNLYANAGRSATSAVFLLAFLLSIYEYEILVLPVSGWGEVTGPSTAQRIQGQLLYFYVSFLKTKGIQTKRRHLEVSSPKSFSSSTKSPSPYFKTFMEPRNRFQGMNSASLCTMYYVLWRAGTITLFLLGS
jgi:hypothetical protein